MKILKWTSVIFLGLVSTLLLLALFVFTPWGTQLVLKGADVWLDELTIEYKSGGLGTELQLTKVRWQQAELAATIDDIQLNMEWSCTWSMAVCINTVKTGVIDVQLTAQADDVPSQSPAPPLALPFNLKVDDIKLGPLNLLIKDQLSLAWQSLESRLTFAQSLQVTHLNVTALQLDLLANEDASGPSEAFDWSSWQYQAIEELPINLPLNFDITEVLVAPFELRSKGQQTLALSSVAISAKADTNHLTLRQLHVRHALAEVSASAEVGIAGDLKHQLNVKARYIEPEGGEVNLALSSNGDINQLNVLAQVSGLVSAELNINAQPSSGKLPLDLKLAWQKLRWPLSAQSTEVPAIFQSSEGELTLSGNLDGLLLSGQGQVSGQAIPSTSFTLQGSADRKTLLLDSLNLNTLGGQIIAKGRLDFSDHLSIETRLELQHINPGILQPEYQADISGQMQASLSNPNGQWQAHLSELDINGLWRDFPLKISGDAQLDGASNLVLNNVSIANGDNHVVLNGQLHSDRRLDFDLQLTALALEQSVAAVQGRLIASAHVGGTIEQLAVQYKLDGQDLAFADIQIAALDGQGELLWDDVKPLSLQLVARQIAGNNNYIDEAKLSLTGNAASHELLLDASGQQTNLRAKIQGTLHSNAWQGQWLEGKIKSSYAVLTLVEPFSINANWLTQEYSISPHCWREGSSDLCVQQANFKEQQASWDLSLRELSIIPLLQRAVPAFPQVNADTKLSMTLEGSWVLNELPRAVLNASLSPAIWRFKNDNKQQLEINEFKIESLLSEQNVRLDVRLSGPQVGLLSLNLQGEAGDFSNQLERPISGKLSLAEINLAPFRLFLPQLDKFEGLLVGETLISGTLQQPLVNGLITLKDGAVQGQDIPLIISGLNQSIELKGDKALLSGSYLLGKGQGTVAGELAWQPELKGNIKFSGQNLELDYQSMLRAQVSPDIDIQFSPDLVKVSGEIVVPYARFKLRELPQGTVSPSKDVVLVEQQAKMREEKQILALDVKVSVDPNKRNDVKLDAFGLTTDLRGNMRIENSKLGILANGDVQLINGRYRAYGQNLLIREGDITFNGPFERPFLSIEAVRDPKLTADNVVAGIRVEGAADSPKVAVFSEPEMEQQQSLSYMLTGRGLGQSSGDSQETMLTNMLLGFGLGQSENMVSNIGQKLGFKDVALDTSGQGDNTQLSVSGYVAPGVQLRYGVGVFESISEVAIRYELLPQLYIEAVSGLSNAIDIYYSFSIEGSQNLKALDKKASQ